MKAALLVTLIAGLSVPAFAEANFKASAPPADNRDMKVIFADDQRVRQPGFRGAWDDEQRRAKVRDLLARDALKTGLDFEEAAFIFQHGDTPDDYLLAHSLAMIAVAKGHKAALWIAGATLDRYLQRIGQKQIYGTQYQLLDHQGKFSLNGHWTQEPYDRNLVSDALRRDLGLPPLAQQQVMMEKYSKDLVEHFKAEDARLKAGK